MYKKRQSKETLGISTLKNITVQNREQNNGMFKVIFRVKSYDGARRSFQTLEDAINFSNKNFKEIYGNKRKAVKNGCWNEIL